MSPFLGRWDLTLATANGPRPSWLEIQLSGPRTLVGRFVGTAGSARPISKVDVTGDTFSFSIPPQCERGDKDLHVEGKIDGDGLTGWLTDPSGTRVTWTAAARAVAATTSPVEWNDPVEIFNGRDTSGWHVQQGASQWVVIDHTLTSPKSGANLVSDRMFTDFTLHIEFRYPKGSNSGIYLRGRYEVQIEDSRRARAHAAIASARSSASSRRAKTRRRKPATGRPSTSFSPAGMVTVILNGTTIIANQEIPGITGGAIDSNEAAAGPIMLQGDHGPIEFRKIIVRPAK